MRELIEVRESNEKDLIGVLDIHRSAFGSEEEAELVRDLLNDPSAEPRLSLLGLMNGEPAGHILFTNVVFEPAIEVQGSILGPLAVAPAFQKGGIGGNLIKEGLRILADRGIDWVFVLGHESYYPRFGFKPAQEQGFQPPYPFPEEITRPWMAQALTPTCIAPYQGKVIPAKAFEDPKYWRE